MLDAEGRFFAGAGRGGSASPPKRRRVVVRGRRERNPAGGLLRRSLLRTEEGRAEGGGADASNSRLGERPSLLDHVRGRVSQARSALETEEMLIADERRGREEEADTGTARSSAGQKTRLHEGSHEAARAANEPVEFESPDAQPLHLSRDPGTITVSELRHCAARVWDLHGFCCDERVVLRFPRFSLLKRCLAIERRAGGGEQGGGWGASTAFRAGLEIARVENPELLVATGLLSSDTFIVSWVPALLRNWGGFSILALIFGPTLP